MSRRDFGTSVYSLAIIQCHKYVLVSQATPFNMLQSPREEGLVNSRTTSCSTTGSCRFQSADHVTLRNPCGAINA